MGTLGFIKLIHQTLETPNPHSGTLPMLKFKGRLKLFATIFIVRIVSVFLAKSEFVPDEGWQSIEVSRWFVYGKESGYLTWEWVLGIRSFIYPLLFVPTTFLHRYFQLESTFLLTTFPRLLHALLCATGECCLLRYCFRRFGEHRTRWIGHFLTINWFMFYCASRHLTNNTEMALGLIGLELLDLGYMPAFTACVGISFCFRPTSVIFWFPLTRKIVSKVFKNRNATLEVLLVGILVLLLNTLCDSHFFNNFEQPWWKFLKFNILQGQSAQYGTHPFFWYFYSALPSLLGVNVLWVFAAWIFWSPKYFHLMAIILNYVFVFSLIGHKEIRFLMPILPLCCVIAGDCWCLLMKISKSVASRRLRLFFKFVLAINLILSAGASAIFCGLHQVGIKPAANFVSHESRALDEPNIWILMPCFSFPFHTYINNPQSKLEYFTCVPSGMDYPSPNVQKVDFSDVDLSAFVENKVVIQDIVPDFVILYDHSREKVELALTKFTPYKYEMCFDAFHTMFPFDNVGRRVQVLCKK